jgi:hypothetical protein
VCCLACCCVARNEARHQEYLERQANRATREKEHKPAKFEHEVRVAHAPAWRLLLCL